MIYICKPCNKSFVNEYEYEKHVRTQHEIKIPSLKLKMGKAVHGLKHNLLNHKAIKELAKEHNKRVGADFFACLERHVKNKIIKACGTWDGQKKTLDAVIAGWVRLK